MADIEGLREFAISAAKAAIAAVEPAVCIPRAVRVDRDRLLVGAERIDLSSVDRVLVVGMGKASPAMAASLEAILGDRISGGLVVTADGYAVSTQRIEIQEAAHPVPDERGLAAAEDVAHIVQDAGPHDLVIVLVSGGGSALLPLPVSGLTLEDLAETNDLLLRAAVPIQEINAIRKHLSALKGGRLAALAHPARVISLILSDVPEDRLDAIASGPTAPDPTTYRDAARIAKRAGIWDALPSTVRAITLRGLQGELEETLKPDDARLAQVSNVLVGSGRVAAEAARAFALEQGYRSAVLASAVQGEAGLVGPVLASIAHEVLGHGLPIPPPALLVAAGETTVIVKGDGRGGRSQEVALSAAAGIDGLEGVVVCAVGTDGRDGPTDAAGGIVDGGSAGRVRAAGLRIADVLADNASYDALLAAGDLVITGPTRTNVADLLLVAVAEG